MSYINLYTGVKGILGRRFGGLGNDKAWAEGVYIKVTNASGGTILLGGLVKPLGGASGGAWGQYTSTTADLSTLGVCAGVIDPLTEMVHAKNVPNGQVMAVLMTGIGKVLASMTVTAGQYVISSAVTSGRADGVTKYQAGAIGVFVANGNAGDRVMAALGLASIAATSGIVDTTGTITGALGNPPSGTTYILSNDGRLVDARTPLPHASTHMGGSDPINAAGIGADAAGAAATVQTHLNTEIARAEAAEAAIVAGTGPQAMITASDTTPAYLHDKLVDGSGNPFTVLNPGANEKLKITGSGGGGGGTAAENAGANLAAYNLFR